MVVQSFKGGTVQFHWMPDPDIFADAMMEVAAELGNMTLPLHASRQILQDDIEERFITETAPSGDPWQEWSTGEEVEGVSSGGYAEVAARYPNAGILRQTQELYDSATRSSNFILSHNSVY